MNTSKPISTISYNSLAFLKNTLDSLVKQKVISFYMFIPHHGEYDEVTNIVDKDHTHVWVFPNRHINTMDLGDFFVEPVPNKKPLKCISWVSSKSDDFILYNLHDKDYLMSKFEIRQYNYTYNDWVSSDQDEFDRRYKMAFNSSGHAKNKNFYKYIATGGTVHELVKNGCVDPNQVEYYNNFAKEVRKHEVCNFEE